MSPFLHDQPFGTLDQLRPGINAVVLEVHAHDQPVCLRLQELGLVPGAPVQVLSNSAGLLLLLGDQRLCLGEDLAKAVDVLPV